jgi:hypothetical protein
MARRTLFVLTVIVALVAFPITVRAQAAAESALANSVSGTAAAKTGSALGKGLGQINNKLADQMGSATKQPQAQPVAPGPKTVELPEAKSAPGAPIPNNSPLVLSIQGTGKDCTPENKAAESPSGAQTPAPQAVSGTDQSFVVCNPRSNLNTKQKNRTSTVEVTF